VSFLFPGQLSGVGDDDKKSNNEAENKQAVRFVEQRRASNTVQFPLKNEIEG